MTEKLSKETHENVRVREQGQAIEIEGRLGKHCRKLLVLSGKGGVGKSTVAANLAVALAQIGKQVGLLDVDVHGPSIPKIMGLEGQKIGLEKGKYLPVEVDPHLKVMSIGFLVKSDNDAVIWRGPMKFKLIQQFFIEVAWGKLDYLVIDCPPGTGDEPLSVAQLAGSGAGAVVVTTPQDVAIADVRRCITFCRKMSLPVIGIIENMSGLVCPHCGHTLQLFKSGGGMSLAQEMSVPFLGAIPIDPLVVDSGDTGKPFMEMSPLSESARAFARVVDRILTLEDTLISASKKE